MYYTLNINEDGVRNMDVVSILECNHEKLYNLSDIVIKFKKYYSR